MNSRLRQLLVTGVAGAALVVTGCSASVSIGDKSEAPKPSVAASVLETNSAQQLAQDPANVPAVRCDGGLEGTIGYTQSCEVQILGEWHPYTATVVSVEGDQINWNIKADDPDSIPQ
ncbi:DUF4333 domain-containing protein [Gordonia alkaliphila]|uniref:DUF4333 domain-containing protein n=1 Tax=Gordonia alkaliphila TaxID=1053547 RepID=UPI001FF55623|nr:DUF4333 domain-containing protein [Gordonia alkaliphila]MCK0438630.1 DUF4333 domain-containing protein [Gordonia alkaliphila]